MPTRPTDELSSAAAIASETFKAVIIAAFSAASSVLAWPDERVEVRPFYDPPTVRTRYAYEQFQSWAVAEGFKRDTLPAINGFVQRITRQRSRHQAPTEPGGSLFSGHGRAPLRAAITLTRGDDAEVTQRRPLIH